MLYRLLLMVTVMGLGTYGVLAQDDVSAPGESKGSGIAEYETIQHAFSIENGTPRFFTWDISDVTGNGHDDVAVAVEDNDFYIVEIWEGGSGFDEPMHVIETTFTAIGDIDGGYFTDGDRADIAILGNFEDVDRTVAEVHLYAAGDEVDNDPHLTITDTEFHPGVSGLNDPSNAMVNAGDINNSGYHDLMIGSSNRDDDDGNPLPVVIFEGGADMGGERDHALDYYTAGAVDPGGWRGNTLHRLGDVSGNGVDDFAYATTDEVVDGELDDAEHTGVVHIFYGQDGEEGDVSFDQADASLHTNREDAQDGVRQWLLGFSEVAVGDFNGNGYKDLAVKSHRHRDGDEAGVPGIHIYNGSSDGFNSQPDHMVGLLNQIMAIESYAGRYVDQMHHVMMRGIPDQNDSGHDELLVVAGSGYTNVVLLEGTDDSINEDPVVVFEAPDQDADFGASTGTARQTKSTVGNFSDNDAPDFIVIQPDVDGTPMHMYHLEDATFTSVDEIEKVPESFVLKQNYPNPFNPTTNIQYHLPEAADVQLKVFDVLGRQVTTLVNSQQSAGTYEVSFDASELSSGTYLYRLEAGEYTETRQMMFVK